VSDRAVIKYQIREPAPWHAGCLVTVRSARGAGAGERGNEALDQMIYLQQQLDPHGDVPVLDER
jgi:hypothetical protein